MRSASNDPIERFSERYVSAGSRARLAAEAEVLGSDYQANGYTTRAQADDLGAALRLGAGDLLLDLGSGCGWPGLYLAEQNGCAVVTIDPVASGAITSAERAERDALTDRHLAVVGRGDALPFRDRSFDAIVHGDVMC